MHGGPAPGVVGVVGVCGSGTPWQFGDPVVVPCASLADVAGPTMPSTVIPAADWNHRMARSVFGPSLPSTAPALQKSAFSCRWVDWIPAASLAFLLAAADEPERQVCL